MGYRLTTSALVIAVLSPILGAIADRGGRRKPWLGGCTAICVAAVLGMWFVAPGPDHALLALVLLFVANIGFELGTVFYNAMLTDIAPRAMYGRISGWGWGLGYIGGLCCMLLALFGFVPCRARGSCCRARSSCLPAPAEPGFRSASSMITSGFTGT